MATITITIADTDLPNVISAFTKAYSYEAILKDGTTNPITAAEFTKNHIARFVKEMTEAYLINQATATAAATAETQASTISIS